jgi:ABC-type nitrate/sulfonate/bicarbonate transport system substrate-binding protein
LIWLRRLLPVIVLAAAVGGYFLWDKWSAQRQLQEQDRVALVTAQVWIATAKYRNEPERYIQYRDSLLEANGASREEISRYLERTGDPPEELLPFARRVQGLVDSLYRIEDSVLKDADRLTRDSAEAAKTQVR